MNGPDVFSVRVPFRSVRRGGRKLIITPENAPALKRPDAEPEVDPVLLKAIMRAWRWRRAIEDGWAASITEIAEREGLTDSFVTRMLALTTLAPDILQDVLDGRQPPSLTLQKVVGAVSPSWREQRACFCLEDSGREIGRKRNDGFQDRDVV